MSPFGGFKSFEPSVSEFRFTPPSQPQAFTTPQSCSHPSGQTMPPPSCCCCCCCCCRCRMRLNHQQDDDDHKGHQSLLAPAPAAKFLFGGISPPLDTFSFGHDSSLAERSLRITIQAGHSLAEKLINYIHTTINEKRVIVAERDPIYYDMLNVSEFGDLLIKQKQEILKTMENKTKYSKRETAIHDLHRLVIIKEDVCIDDVFALEERMLTAGNLGISVICLVSNPPESWKKRTDFVFVDAVALQELNMTMPYESIADLRHWVQGDDMKHSDHITVIAVCALKKDTVVIDVAKKKLMVLKAQAIDERLKEGMK